MKHALSTLALASTAAAISQLAQAGGGAGSCPGDRTYTLNADFNEGVLVNVEAVDNKLQIANNPVPFPFIWVAASQRGTIIKINTETGQILGEYLSAPNGRGRNPSRTTVDFNGAVWAGNRDENSGGMGSVVQVALAESCCDCVDRNNNGIIETSTGLGDIRPWSNPGGVDNGGGVSSAEDECIIKYVRVGGDFVRHVSVDGNNNVWTAGNFGADNHFDLIDGSTGAILASFNVGVGGYGGLVDGNGVIWSANRGPGPLALLRYDTKNTISTLDDTFDVLNTGESYGLARDTNGSIWHSLYSANQIRKYSPAGVVQGLFPTGGPAGDRGVAVTTVDNDVWVCNSDGNSISRLGNNGTLKKVISLGADGQTPTGVAVDGLGKVWATCLNSNTVKRIDPNAGFDGLGEVDLTVPLGAGAGPYNYSDMTGTVLLSANAFGTWTVSRDGGETDAVWREVNWNTEGCVDPTVPAGTSLNVEVRAANTIADLAFAPLVAVVNGAPLPGVTGQFIQVKVTFNGVNVPFATPVLCDLTVLQECNEPPACGTAENVVIWPPNHHYVSFNLSDITNVTDPDGDPISLTVTKVTQDEPLNTNGDGNTTCDATGVGTDTVSVRAERLGPGNGRVYRVNFMAADGQGGECSGSVDITVPKSQNGNPAVDSGQSYCSTDCFNTSDLNADGAVNVNDLLGVINGWGQFGPDSTINWPDADINDDETVNVLDLLTVIGNWSF